MVLSSVRPVSEILVAISILLVFFSVFIDLLSRRAEPALTRRLPTSSEVEEANRLRWQLRNLLWQGAIPLSVGLLLVCYSLAPTVFAAVHNFELRLWDFDPVPRLFLIIFCGICVLTVISGRLLIRIALRLRRAKRIHHSSRKHIES